MKLNIIERCITNSPMRAYFQKHVEGPMLKNMGSGKRYPLCLEIGCGKGVGAEIIAEQFSAGRVIATDIDPEQIERAKKNLKPELNDKIEFRIGDAMLLDEPDEKFDAVFSFGVIHHLENWRKAIKEIARVLKKDGEFFFEELLRPFLNSFPVRKLTAHPAGGIFSFEEFKETLGSEGIEIINFKRFDNIVVFGAGRKIRRGK